MEERKEVVKTAGTYDSVNSDNRLSFVLTCVGNYNIVSFDFN